MDRGDKLNTMVNKKQIDGQNLCKCNHKEFHHKDTSDGKCVCCISGCPCEQYELKIIFDNKVKKRYVK